MDEFQKMLAGELYDPSDKKLKQLNTKANRLLDRFNHSRYDDQSERQTILHSLLGSIGDNVTIKLNFYCDYGCNIHVGNNFFTNYNCVILDCAQVSFGDDCMLGPQVGIYTATHPLDPVERASGLEFAKAIRIGNNCWIGGHATINPGVVLGNNVVVASGSVVTKSFHDNVVIGGNPAKVLRDIKS